MGKLRSMNGSRFTIVLLLGAVASSGGCASPFLAGTPGLITLETTKVVDAGPARSGGSPTTGFKSGDSAAKGPTSAAPESNASSAATASADIGQLPVTAANLELALPRQSTPGIGDGRELAALIAELQDLGALDPAAQQSLLDDLKQSDPAVWPQLVRQFRTALAYRKQTGKGSDFGELSRTGVGGQGSVSTVEPGSGQTVLAPEKPDEVAMVSASAQQAAPNRKASAEDPGRHSPQSADPKPSAEASEKLKSAEEWQLHVTKAILALEGLAANSSASAGEINRQVQLRLLYLAAGRRDDALRPVAGLSAVQQEFWTKEIYGLATYLDAERVADPDRRATEAALHLREAAARLGELASPVVHNLAFCKEVTGFGVFKKFPKYEFKPGEEVLLYCEIDNLANESTDKGFHTSVKSSYQILDSRGERVAEQEFPNSEDFCTSPRRDFFIPYFIWVPKRINEGTYTLQVTIEDTQSKKIGQSSIQFSVK
jgi:hypothetical protein